MSWVSYLQTDWQYGQVPVTEARTHLAHHTLATAIDRHLFPSTSEGGASGQSLQQRVRAFESELLSLQPTGKAGLRTLWADLQIGPAVAAPPPPEGICGPPATPAEAAASQKSDDTWAQTPGARLYCLALYTLCWCLAAGPLAIHRQAEASDDEDDDEAGGEDDDVAQIEVFEEQLGEAFMAETATDAGTGQGTPADASAVSDGEALCCWAHEVVNDMARDLLRALPRSPEATLRVGADEAEDQARLVAEVLLAALLRTLPSEFHARQEEVSGRGADGVWRSFRRIRIHSESLPERLSVLLQGLPQRLTFQPLTTPPRYVPAEDSAATPGDELVAQSLLAYRRSNRFLRRFHQRIESGAGFVQALNAQQAVAWRINLVVLQTACLVAGLAHKRAQWTDGLADEVRQAGLDEAEVLSWQAWSAQEFFTPVADASSRKSYRKPGELLEHVLAKKSLEALATIDNTGQQPPFFLPWMADYRGRIYPRTPWLSPQGADLQRALFEFSEGSPLDAAGVQALKRHGANLIKRGRLLDDLGITDRKVVTLEEREQWVSLHEAQILASARSPLKCNFWRDASGKPMQFLAFCLAYRQWQENPHEPCHLPVQIDGTCNGLQHIAALTGDVSLALSVNVLAREDQLPGDIYSEVAGQARELSRAARQQQGSGEPAAGSLPRPPRRRQATALEVAKQALTDRAEVALTLLDHAEWIDRDIAKTVIMTVPYGAAASAQAAHVLAAIAGRIEEALADEGGPLWAAVRELGTAVEALSAHPSGTTSAFLRRMRGCLRAVATGGQADSLLARLRKKAYEAYPRSVPKASGALPESPASPQASGGDHAVIGQDDWYDWLGVAALGAFAAREIVAALRKTLDSRYPGVNGFGRWLKEVGTACSGMPLTLMAGRQYRGMPLTWLTPLGLPVCQDKFRLRRSSLSADFGGKRISIGTRRLTEEVSWMSQQNALLPNLIHSLDATHLAMTINSAVARGLHRFGSIHDCLLCHPSEAERFGELLRNSFRELYKTGKNGRRPAVLVQWSIWMQIVADIATTDQVLVLLGALDVPDGFGERLLRTLPNTDAVSLLDRIRRLDQARQSVARLLLEFRRDAADAQAGAGVGRQVLPELPGGGDFNVDGVIDSRYFFS